MIKRCSRCGRQLKTLSAIAASMGKVCAEKDAIYAERFLISLFDDPEPVKSRKRKGVARNGPPA